MIGNSGRNTHSFPVTGQVLVQQFIKAGEELLSGKIPCKAWLRPISHYYTPSEVYRYAVRIAKRPSWGYEAFGVPYIFQAQSGYTVPAKTERSPKRSTWVRRDPVFSLEDELRKCPRKSRPELLALSAVAKDKVKEAKERKVDAARSRALVARVRAAHNAEFEAQMGLFDKFVRPQVEQLGQAFGRGLASGAKDDVVATAADCVTSAVHRASEMATDKINTFVAQVRSLIASVTTVIGDFFSEMGPIVKLFSTIAAVAIPVWFFYALMKWTGITHSIVSAISSFFVPEVPACTTQMGENGETEAIGQALFAATLAALIPKDKTQAKMWAPFVALMTKSTPFVTGAKNMVDWVCEGIQWTVNMVLRMVGSGEIQWFRKRAEQIEVWLARSRDYLKAEDDPPPEEIVRHWSDGHDLVRTAVGAISKAEIEAMLRQLTQKWNVARTQRALMKAARPEPVCLVLHGQPGIGKSVSLEYFHKYVTVSTNADIADKVRAAHHEGKEYPLTAHAYVKDSGKYWTGYNPAQHTTMILDDGGTRKPAPGADDSDFINLMRIVNSAPVSLDMPDIESKGNVFFRSPFVIVSTNLDRDQWYSNADRVINNPDALQRRMKLFLTVTIANPEMVRDGKLDVDKWTMASHEVQDTTWAYNGHWDGNPVTFNSRKAVAAFVVEKMMQAKGHFIKMEANSTHQALFDALGLDFEAVHAQMGLSPVDREINNNIEFLMRLEAERAAAVPPAPDIWDRIADVLEWCDKSPWYIYYPVSFLVGVAGTALCNALLSTVRAGVGAIYQFFKPQAKNYQIQAQDPTSVMDNVTNNMYVLGVGEPKEGIRNSLGTILFISEDYALMPHHFLIGMAKAQRDPIFEGCVPIIKSLGLGTSIPMSWGNFQADGSNVHIILGYDGQHQDLCLVKLPVRNHKNIISSFMLQGTRRPFDLGWVTANNDFAPQWVAELPRPEYLQDFVYENQCVQRAVCYRMKTHKGDCGSVVVSQGACGRVYVVGMHVAGADNQAFGVAGIVFQDQLERAMARIKQSVNKLVFTGLSITTNNFKAEMQSGSALDTRAVALTTFKNGVPDRPGAPPSMVPSVAVGWSGQLLPHGKVPSDCTEAATERALEAYAQPRAFPVEGAIGVYAYEAARRMLDDVGAPVRFNTRIPTNLEAVNGRVYGIAFAEPINRRTSSGYPWQNVGHVKARMFDQNTGEVLLGSETTKIIFKEADELLDALLAGDESALNYVLFKVSPKPEMRKVGKDPRIIQGAPLHLVIVFRRLFWSLMLHFSQWSPEKELAIGLDPARHWTDLHNWLVEKRPEGFGECMVGAGDYKQFDQCQEPVISRAIGEAVLDRFYTASPYDTARRLVWSTLCGARVVFKNVVYKLDKGMPSGHPATSIANGLYNGVLFRMAFASIMMDGSDADVFPGGFEAYVEYVRMFRDKVHLSVCGDDNIFATDEPAFNEMALAGCMARFGARYTMDVKDQSATQCFRPIEDVSYLGRGFRWEGLADKWVAPLRLESVALMGQYAQKESQLCPEWYTSTAKQIREELSQHEQEVWDAWMPAFKATFVDRGFVPPFATQEGVASHRVRWQPLSLLPDGGDQEF